MTTPHTHMIVHPEGQTTTRIEAFPLDPRRYAIDGTRVTTPLRFACSNPDLHTGVITAYLYAGDAQEPNLTASLMIPLLGGPLVLLHGPVVLDIPGAADHVWPLLRMYSVDLRDVLAGNNPTHLGDQSLAYAMRRIAQALSRSADLDSRWTTLVPVFRGAVNL